MKPLGLIATAGATPAYPMSPEQPCPRWRHLVRSEDLAHQIAREVYRAGIR